MKRITRALVATGWLAGVSTGSAAPAPRNLLVNGDCEPLPDQRQDETNPPGWARWLDPGATGEFIWDASAGRPSKTRLTQYALRIDNAGQRAGWVTAAPIAVSDRKTYLLAGYVSAYRSAGEVRYAVRFTGPAGLLGESWTPAVSGSTGPRHNEWVYVATKVVPPEGATHAAVMARADHLLGSAWFDDAWFGELPDPVPDAGAVRARALARVGSRGADPRGFGTAFDAGREKAAAAIASVKSAGRMWQPAAIALARAEVLRGAGEQDLVSGWTRRGWERLGAAAEELRRAGDAAGRAGLPADPLPAPSTATSATFPFGVALAYRGPADPARLAAEMARLGRFGFRAVSADLPWGMWEPSPGAFDWTVPDTLAAAAADSGVALWAGAGPKYGAIGGRMPGAKVSLAGFTPWYLERHPESALASSAGEHIAKCDGLFWEIALVDPRRLAAVPPHLETLATSLRALRDRLAGRPGVAGWLLSPSPRLGAGPDPLRHLAAAGLLGHNTSYIDSFRVWLADRYATPAALKAAWGKSAPASFAQAVPPGPAAIRAAEPLSGSRYVGAQAWIGDWLAFRADALAGGVGWEAELLADAGRPAVARFPELTPGGPLDPEGLAAEALRGSGTALVDAPIGMELAPEAVPFPLLDHAQSVALAAASSAGRTLWLTDYAFRSSGVMGGEDRQDLFAPAYAGPYLASAVLAGARGFFLRGWTGRVGPGSLAYPGRTSATEPALSEEGLAALLPGRAFAELGPWLAGARPAVPRLGVLTCRRTQLHDDPESLHLTAVLNALALAGVQGAALVSDRAVEAGDIPCEVLIAPFATRVSPAALRAIVAWVEAGGLLVTDTYLGTRADDGSPRRPLGEGLDRLLGVSLDAAGTGWTDASTIGFMPTPEFTERVPPLPVSLSFWSGLHHVTASPGTEVLGLFTARNAKGERVPAITLRTAGRGRAALFPRVRLMAENIANVRGLRVTRPELREFRMGRSNHHLNGWFYAVTLRSLLARVGALPPARLARAPVATPFLDSIAALGRAAGAPAEDLALSATLVRSTQTGLPHFGKFDLESMEENFGMVYEEAAQIRVGALASPGGGVLVVVASYSPWGREAELIVPGGFGGTLDLLTGESFPVRAGRLGCPVGPYQVRLLALTP